MSALGTLDHAESLRVTSSDVTISYEGPYSTSGPNVNAKLKIKIKNFHGFFKICLRISVALPHCCRL